MDIKTDAWAHRDDLVQLDWQEISQSHNYPLANVLRPSKRKAITVNVIFGVLFVLAIIGAVMECF